MISQAVNDPKTLERLWDPPKRAVNLERVAGTMLAPMKRKRDHG